MYSISKDAIYCVARIFFANKNKIRSSSFWDGGFSDWKHLNPRVSKLENSDSHSKCKNNWKEFEKMIERCKNHQRRVTKSYPE